MRYTGVGRQPPQGTNGYAYRKNIAMLIDAGLRLDEVWVAADDLYDEQKRGGVYLDGNRQKVWVIAKHNEERKGWELYAPLLKITASDDPSYWELRRETESKGSENNRGSVDIKVAYLKKVKWLEVRGKLSTIKLTANTKYKVYFILKTTTDGQRWDPNLQVTFRLYVPNIGRQERQSNICHSSTWQKCYVGEFLNDQRTVGTMEFHMEQLENIWKHGLVIKGVRIEPEKFQD